jgi:hypothetical protein
MVQSTTQTTTTVITSVPPVQDAYLYGDDENHITGVRHVGPERKGDVRVPSAPGLALISLISQVLLRRSRLSRGWLNIPEISINAPRQLVLRGGEVILPSYPGIFKIKTPWSFDIPPLALSTSGMIQRQDYVYIVSMVVYVGVAHNPKYNVTFAYRPEDSADIKVDTKENEQRFGAFIGIVVSQEELTPEKLYANLTPTENSRRTITIKNKNSAGFLVGNLQFYALDDNWKDQGIYFAEPKLIDVIPVCQVKRIQNVTESGTGITIGRNGEEAFTRDFNIVPMWERLENLSPEAKLERRLLLELFAGVPGKGGSMGRAVLNLTSGPVGNNIGYPGVPASSPNNSVALVTGQRISVTNQACRQDTLSALVTAGNDGNGNAELLFTLSANVPIDTQFSSSVGAHRIFALDGTEISGFGTFRNLGGRGGALIWTGGLNAGQFLQPGQRAYFVPAIDFPPGSGSSIPFKRVNRVWLNANELDKRNIRTAYVDDIDAYAAPVNGELHFVVTGPERAALVHYLLKHISIQTDSRGVGRIPSTENGCFAFIEGVFNPDGSARLDKPIISGLTANATYRALIYKAPLLDETWQFQVSYPLYEGIGVADPGFLDGATIVSRAIAFAHTQGSGTSVFAGEASLQYSPIAMFLPIGSGDIKYYQLDAPIQWVNEGGVGDITFRQMPVVPGSGLALPISGQRLTWTPSTNVPPRSMAGTIKTKEGNTIGFRAPKLQGGLPYQVVYAFLAEKDGVQRVVVITRNTVGDEAIAADSNLSAGIDLFSL